MNEPCSSMASGMESWESSSVGYRKVLRNFAEVRSILAVVLFYFNEGACDRKVDVNQARELSALHLQGARGSTALF